MKKDPSSKPPYSSKPPENDIDQLLEAENELLAELGSARSKKILKPYLKIETDSFNLRHLMVFRHQFGEDFDLVAARVDELTRFYGCSAENTRQILLEKLNNDDFPKRELDQRGEWEWTPEELKRMRGEVRKAVVPVESGEVDTSAHTMPSSVPPVKPIEHTQSMPPVVISTVTLSPDMNSQEFVGALTEEGKEMLRQLLLLREDIKDAEAIQKLERETGMKGYLALAMHVGDRVISRPEARQELGNALKANEPEIAPFTKKGTEPSRSMTLSPWDARSQVAVQPAVPNIDQGPFIRSRRAEQITVSPWQSEIGQTLQEEVVTFFDKFTPEAKDLLRAVLNTENTDDPVEVAKMINEYAPKESSGSFKIMNDSVAQYCKRLSRPEDEVRKALAIKLVGGGALPEMQPEAPGLNPRQQPTVLSNNAQRGLLSRILGGGRRRK